MLSVHCQPQEHTRDGLPCSTAPGGRAGSHPFWVLFLSLSFNRAARSPDPQHPAPVRAAPKPAACGISHQPPSLHRSPASPHRSTNNHASALIASSVSALPSAQLGLLLWTSRATLAPKGSPCPHGVHGFHATGTKDSGGPFPRSGVSQPLTLHMES